MELTDHPWFVAVQFHPEFKSKPTQAHPLFRDFVAAALRLRGANRSGGRPNWSPGHGNLRDGPGSHVERGDPPMIVTARHYLDSTWVELSIRGDRIVEVRPVDGPAADPPRGRLGRAGVLGHPDQRPMGTLLFQPGSDRRAGG